MTIRSGFEHGFTLIELMITLVILAILITVGIPSLSEFIAEQRVRTTASDLISDMALARAEAIKESRRVIMEPLGGAGTWKNGWRVCIVDNNHACIAATGIRKISTPVPGRSAVCATANIDAGVVFRPDGRAAYVSAPGVLTQAAQTDGIKVSDDMGDSATTNDRIRMVLIGISGRASLEVATSATRAVCPGFP